MMEMASYWMLEKQLVHKIFKVLVPRFERYQGAVTNMVKAPTICPAPSHGRLHFPRSVLEFKGNPFPPLNPDDSFRNKNLIHNVLLDAARKDYYREQRNAQKVAKKDPKEE